MANARLASWLAASASLLVVPAFGWAQVAPAPLPFPSSLPLSTEPIVVGEFPTTVGGSVLGSWVGPPMIVGPGAGSQGDTSARVRRRGDLPWKSLHDRGWQALRSIVPDEATRTRNLKTAEALFRAALERLQPYQADDARVATNYNDLAWVFLLSGRNRDARSMAQWALADREARHGPFDPQVGDSLILMAKIAVADKQLDEAERFAERALRAYTRSSTGRQTDIHTPIALDVLGQIAAERGRLEVAEAYIRRAFEWRQEVYDYDLYPPDKYIQVIVELARSNVTLATLLRKLDRVTEAEILEDQAKYLLESAAGVPAPGSGGGAAPGGGAGAPGGGGVPAPGPAF